ncbi:protein phosphatase 1 regulatory subunit 21 [Pelomyxa schiedti]|nr:protein phosphatase 1 regulatory subunit 21 [Pelomyxa schiedti]
MSFVQHLRSLSSSSSSTSTPSSSTTTPGAGLRTSPGGGGGGGGGGAPTTTTTTTTLPTGVIVVGGGTTQNNVGGGITPLHSSGPATTPSAFWPASILQRQQQQPGATNTTMGVPTGSVGGGGNTSNNIMNTGGVGVRATTPPGAAILPPSYSSYPAASNISGGRTSAPMTTNNPPQPPPPPPPSTPYTFTPTANLNSGTSISPAVSPPLTSSPSRITSPSASQFSSPVTTSSISSATTPPSTPTVPLVPSPSSTIQESNISPSVTPKIAESNLTGSVIGVSSSASMLATIWPASQGDVGAGNVGDSVTGGGEDPEKHKLRMYLAVLKRGVIQEQQKNKELDEALKQKEVLLRTLTEKNDVLEFNNSRLTKKIAVLEEEMSQSKKRGKGDSWFSVTAKGDLNKVREELGIVSHELEEKIAENEGLHMKIFEMKQSDQQTIDQLETHINALKQTIMQYETELESLKVSFKTETEKLSTEKSKLQDSLLVTEKQATFDKELFLQKETLLKQENKQLQTDILKEKVLFNDTVQKPLNMMNIPPFSPSRSESMNSARSNLVSALREVVIEILPEYNKYLLDICESCSKPKMPELSNKLRTFIEFDKTVTTLHMARLTEDAFTAERQEIENNPSDTTCPASVNAKQVAQAHCTLHSALSSFISVIEAENVITEAVSKKILQNFNEIVSAYSGLAQQTEQMIEVDDQYINSERISHNQRQQRALTTTIQALTKLATSLSALHSIYFGPSFPVRGALVAATHFGASPITPMISFTKGFLAKINSSEITPGVGYNVALKNREELTELTQQFTQSKRTNENLQSEIVTMRNQNTQLQSKLSSVQEAYAAKILELNLITEQTGAGKPAPASPPPAISSVSSIISTDLLNGSPVISATKPQPLTEVAAPQPSSPPSSSDAIALLLQGNFTAPSPKADPSLFLGDDILLPDKADKASPAPTLGFNLISFDGPVTPTNTSRPITPPKLPPPKTVPDVDNLLDLSPPQTTSSIILDTDTKPKDSSSYSLVVIDEYGNQASKIGMTTEDRERENSLRKYYDSQIVHLTSQLQAADAKAVRLHENMHKAQDEIELLVRKRTDACAQLESANSQLTNNEATKAAYEKQMQLLTETYIGLSEQVAQREAELRDIKSCQVQCAKCKVWNSVGYLVTDGKKGNQCSKGNHTTLTFKAKYFTYEVNSIFSLHI